MDDIVIAASKRTKDKLIEFLNRKFIVKDLGEMRHIHGMKVYQLRKQSMIHISQPALIEKLVKTATTAEQFGEVFARLSSAAAATPDNVTKLSKGA